MVMLCYCRGRTSQSGSSLARIPDKFPGPTHSGGRLLDKWVLRKICFSVNPSKFVKSIYRDPVAWMLRMDYYMAEHPNLGFLCSYIRQISWFRPRSGEGLRDKRVPRKICSSVNPTKIVKTPFRSSHSPEWRAWVIPLSDHPNMEMPFLVFLTHVLVFDPIWRNTTR